MALYRKRPVVIEAFQWHVGDPIDGPDIHRGEGPYEVFVKTLEGLMQIGDGDYVITGVKGERYPCKADIFALTYEPVAASPEQ